MEEEEEELEQVVSVVTALRWIPRGFCLEKPLVFELNEEERGMLQAEGPDEQGQDEEEDLEDEEGMHLSNQLEDMKLNEDAMQKEEEDSDLGSDAEDHVINKTDMLLVTANIEEDQASLEVHAYDVTSGSFYVHHDITLPAYPLCVEWIGVKGRECKWTNSASESFVGVGSFSPEIEIWTLDVVDALEPNCKLVGHQDAVMSLSWNMKMSHLLASGGADSTVRIWDLHTSETVIELDKLHSQQVQSVKWNPAEPTVLLSGSFDQSICIVDGRMPKDSTKFELVESQIESAGWYVHNPAIFYASFEDGTVSFADVRGGTSKGPLFSFQAHSEACSSFNHNAQVPGLFVSSSTDKTVKLWDLQSWIEEGAPKEETRKSEKPSKKKRGKSVSRAPPMPTLQTLQPLLTRKMKVGKIFGCDFAVNAEVNNPEDGDEFDPLLLACGGSKGRVALWHVGSDQEDEFKLELAQSRILPAPKVWGAM